MATDLVAIVHMSGGRWVARCPRPFCTNGECFGRCDDGTTGGLAGDSFRCRPEYGGCGLVCRAQWPDADAVPVIEQLVLARPVPATRNWVPGETPSHLLAENFEHGIVPESVFRDGQVSLVGNEVTRGAIEAGRHIEIGG